MLKLKLKKLWVMMMTPVFWPLPAPHRSCERLGSQLSRSEIHKFRMWRQS